MMMQSEPKVQHPIASYRRNLGINQRILAARSGVSASTIAHLEAGTTNPATLRKRTVKKLARTMAWGVPELEAAIQGWYEQYINISQSKERG